MANFEAPYGNKISVILFVFLSRFFQNGPIYTAQVKETSAVQQNIINELLAERQWLEEDSITKRAAVFKTIKRQLIIWKEPWKRRKR